MQTNIKTPDKSRTYPPNPRGNDVVVKRDILLGDKIVLMTYEFGYEGTQQFRGYTAEVDLCGEHK
jgi:hypothetical protein